MTLTVLALVWGTFAIVVLLAFGNGLQIQMVKANRGLGEGIVIVSGGQTSKPWQGLGKGRPIALVGEDIELLRRRIPGIELISPENERYGLTMTYGRKSITQNVIGVYPSFEDMRTYYPEGGGRFLNQPDLDGERRVIFLVTNVKDKMFGPEDAVGKTVLVNNIPFTVVGVMKKKMQNSMYNGPDTDKAAIPFSTYATIFGEKYLDRMIYKPADPNMAAAVKDDMYRVLARKYKFDPADRQALSLWDTIEDRKIFMKIFAGIQVFLGIVGGLTLLVAGVGVANIMYVSARRRTREIGIKMALGAKKRHIMLQFVSEALMISLAGGLIGIVLSSAVVSLVGGLNIQGSVADILGHPVLSARIMILTSGILGLIGFLAGFFPARRAAALNPVEALRYE